MRVFVAGATGATGQVFVPLATAAGMDLRLHVRPSSAAKTPLSKDPRAEIFDLGNAAELERALKGCDAVLSLIGTMQKRFASGDTYESSDVGTTRQLSRSAKAAGVPRFLLLSSVGAGGMGSYLKMKRECETIVETSGLAWTIFRPSILVSPVDAPEATHGSRKAPPGTSAFFGMVGAIPGLSGWANRMRPIPIRVLCGAFLSVLRNPQHGAILEGDALWAAVG